MLTPWGEKLDKKSVLTEYPRPQLERDSYLCLNGEWDYAITLSPEPPEEYEGTILVPFSPESELSGVNRELSSGEYLWYRLKTALPEGFNKGRLLLNFGAVDQMAAVWVNAQPVAVHEGGFTPFSADITQAAGAGEIEIIVRAQDFTDSSYLCRGTQKKKRGGVWHAAQSGIWQTVWLESVPESYIRGLRIIPHFDGKQVELWVAGEGTCKCEIDGEEHEFSAGSPAVLDIAEMHPWSPEDPYLYSLKLTLGEDCVKSYFAMRKFSVDDHNGCRRLFLNGKPYFHNGVLDQGRWSDGLMTPPSDEAMVFDIELAKRMGFNTIRKYQKIEPLRWYYHCDRLGMLVWQDMPAGGEGWSAIATSGPAIGGLTIKDDRYGVFGRKSPESRESFLREMREMLSTLFNSPCVAVWTPFNEGRGQFDCQEICSAIWKTDQSRPIDPASGWQDQKCGEIRSLHFFAKHYHFEPDVVNRAVALSEFGGLCHRIDGHVSGSKSTGKCFDSANSFKFALRDLYKTQISPAKNEGLAAAIYTQLSDVEEELSGLVTCDRKVIKIAPEIIKTITKMP